MSEAEPVTPNVKVTPLAAEIVAVAEGADYRIAQGDSIRLLSTLADESVDLAVTSPPFSSLFAYSGLPADMGNSRESDDEFLLHFDFVCRALFPKIKPGRNVCMHLQQVTRTKAHHGFLGLFDLRGAVIRAMEKAGFHFYGEVTIQKDPQAQAIRTKAHTLMFVQLRRDSCVSRPALADFLVIFKKPGENEVPIETDVTNEEWIEFARPCWLGIRETETLNTEAAKAGSDERHVCPLQLEFIERCVRMWSNPGETVLDPFLGIGSTAYVAVKQGRKGLGFELKESYFREAAKNMVRATESKKVSQQGLFS